MVRPKLRFLSALPPYDLRPDEAAEAYERARPDLAALPASEVGRVTASVPLVLQTVCGVLPRLDALGGPMREALPLLDHASLGKLGDYTHALYYTNLLAMPSAEDEPDVPAMLAEGAPLRERLLTNAEALTHYGLVDAERVAAIRRGTGHFDTANDLGALSHLYRSGEAELAGKTPVTRAEIDRAAELSLKLIHALGRRRAGSDGAGLPSRHEDERARAFRLVVRTYHQARRAVAYLRWDEGDADAIAPSLFAARRKRRDVEPGAPADGGGGADDGATGTQEFAR
jgi:hypothetical protein